MLVSGHWGVRPAHDPRRGASMIDREPLDTVSSDEDGVEEADTGAQPRGGWACQWCSAMIPLGATACPACGGSAAGRPLPTDPVTGNHYETLDYFGKSGLRDGVVGAAFEAYTGLGGTAERKEKFQQ